MHIILGGTGHVGSAVARALLEKGEPVTVVTRDAGRGRVFGSQGARVAEVDLHDPDRLRTVLRGGRRAFLLNPPADPSTDTDVTERETARCLLDAIAGSGLDGVVALSTYGAQPGEALGDLSVLFALEQALAAQPIPVAVVRAAYLMSNWDAFAGPAREDGVLPTMLPEDLSLPMVAPKDVGRVAAGLLADPARLWGTHHVEGPERYASGQVARAFADAVGRPVHPLVTPRAGWEDAFRSLGFSASAARSYARMTAVTVDGAYEMPSDPIRGDVMLEDYIEELFGP